MCDSGQCISATDLCDGIINCSDKSDETVEHCIARKCQKFSFRCAYGACIADTAECDGQKDCVDNSDETSSYCPSIFSAVFQQGDCQQQQFKCESKECIAASNLCDGKRDCKDGSDETLEYCAGISCPTFGFRCGYGACIASNLRCNGRDDCADGSDENYALCGRARPIKAASGRRKREVTTCSVKDLHPIPTRNIVLIYGNVERKLLDDDTVESGKTVVVQCAEGYKVVFPNEPETITCGSDGKWSAQPRRCDPLCGAGPTDRPLTGIIDVVPNIPWFVNIFRKNATTNTYVEHCIGTILMEKLIVSAMTCFWDSAKNEEIPMDELKVAVGHFTVPHFGENQSNGQFLSIEKILYQNNGHDLSAKDHTIVLVLLSDWIKFGSNVYPVCTDYSKSQSSFNKHTQGRIGGWETWGQGPPRENDTQCLGIIEFPNPELTNCTAHTSIFYIGEKKSCRQFLIAQPIRAEDTGAGVFLTDSTATNRNQYYLEAVLTYTENGKNVVFTDLHSFRYFLLRTYEKYQPK